MNAAAAKDLVLQLLVVDPTRRLSAAQVQRHPWVAMGAVGADAVSLSGAQSKLKEYTARRKLKVARLRLHVSRTRPLPTCVLFCGPGPRGAGLGWGGGGLRSFRGCRWSVLTFGRVVLWYQAHMLAAKAVLAFSRFGKLSLAERMAATAEAAAKEGEEGEAGEAAGAGAGGK